MNQNQKASFRIGVSNSGRPAVWVTRPGELISTEYCFDSEDEAQAWVQTCKKQGRFDRNSWHPTRQWPETD
jgi:hypothetical protein